MAYLFQICFTQIMTQLYTSFGKCKIKLDFLKNQNYFFSFCPISFERIFSKTELENN